MFIPYKYQIYVVHWYQIYILHPGLDIMQAMVFQEKFQPGIRKAIWNGVKTYDIFQRKK